MSILSSFIGRRIRMFVWVGLPVIAVAGIFFGLRDGGAAWKAHNGEGVAGTFSATSARCKLGSDNDCSTVYGTFTSANGAVVRKDVVLYDHPESIEGGGEVAALDSGAPHGVFPADGGTSYVVYTIFLVGGTVAGIAWALFLLTRFRRRKGALAGQPA